MPRLAPKFKEALHRLDFDTSGKENTGLLFISDFKRGKNFSVKEYFALELASEHQADAVYFRRFEDGRAPMPQIFIYDFSKANNTGKELAEIHRDIWSSCAVPVFLVIYKSKIEIYDCCKPVDIDKSSRAISSNPMDILDLANDAVEKFQRYSAKGFDKGTFWEQEAIRQNFSADATAYSRLIEGLKFIRNSFIRESELAPALVDKLLVRCILIKYLEERGNSDKARFAESFFKKFGSNNFSDLLEKGKTLEVFDALAKHFNGRVFAWDGENADAERKVIEKADLSGLAKYLDGTNISGPFQLWRLFSFQYLPVEVISSIYEAFLKENEDSGLVYTPDHLVNLLVDECMAPDDYIGKESFRVIDGSCGSGIFLVKAFKRMVQWWRYRQYNLTGNRERPDIDVLNDILTKNIYGVELKENAAQLTIFSLAVALCDELSPKEIWNKLKFKDLSKKNIVHTDFFKYLQTADKESFDLVIGNPPFQNKWDEFDNTLAKYKIKPVCDIPQKEKAILFLDQAMNLVKKEGRLCLILPAGPILYNDTRVYRKYFFTEYNVEEIIDFTNLSAILFEGQANVPVVGFYVKKIKPNDENIAHITVNRTQTAKDRIYFEIDHYDFHWVSKEDAINDEFVWKTNLLGGGRLLDIVNRFNKLSTIGEFLKLKKKEGWAFGEGYIVGHDNSIPDAELEKAKYRGRLKFYKGYHLRGQKTLKTDALTENGLEKDAFDIERNNYFMWERDPKLFTPPFMLIKELFGEEKIPTYFSEKKFIYKHRFIGIAAPTNQTAQLRSFYEAFNGNRNFYRFLISIKSSEFLVSRATSIKSEDLRSLPMANDLKPLKLSESEKIIQADVFDYIIDHLSKGENSIISNLTTPAQLRLFSRAYCKTLNSIYEEGNKKFRLHKIIEAPTYYACEYELSKKQINENAISQEVSLKAVSKLESLLVNEYGSSTRIMRVIKLFQGNKVYLIKPKALRYWLRSIALRDADETITEILGA